MSEAFGIMDPAYFVNKNDILKWVNNTLKLNVEKVDHLGSGAVYCQFLDMIFPGTICMGKVNLKAKLEYEFLSNFKLVTNCLDKNDVKKHVDVNKLTKCKYQDNLEFAQWFKKFYDTRCGDRTGDYDPEARRAVKVSSIVEVPKVARKEEQSKQKAINASQPTTSTLQSAVKKALTPSKPAVPTATNTNKRTLGQLYNGSANANKTVGATSKNGSTVSHAPAKTANNNTSTESKEYNALINSIKDILNQGESDQVIVTKIRTLVKVEPPKENTAMATEEKENVDTTVNGGASQIKEQSIFKDTTNTSSIEQEV